MTKQTKIIIIIAIIAVFAGAYFLWRKPGGKSIIPNLGGIGGGSGNGNNTSDPSDDDQQPQPNPDKVKTWGNVTFPIDWYETGIEVLHIQALANLRGSSLALDGIFGANTLREYKKNVLQEADFAKEGVTKVYRYNYNEDVKPYLQSINQYLIAQGKI